MLRNNPHRAWQLLRHQPVQRAPHPLNRYEKTELDALVFYAARLKGMDEETLRHNVENSIGVPDLADMSLFDFLHAKIYLQGHLR